MANNEIERIVLLNQLFSRTKSKAPSEHSAPVHGMEQLFGILEGLWKQGNAREYVQALESNPREFIRIKDMRKLESDGFGYATFLLEHADASAKSFPVVDVKTFEGRELEAETDERGATTAHVCVRYPLTGTFDDCTYRCVFEHVSPISRRMVAMLFNRLLLRHARDADWSFSAMVNKDGRTKKLEYKYHVKLEFVADVGRSLKAFKREISEMVFIKRAAVHSIGMESTVDYKEVLCDVEYRISASRGPENPVERRTWLQKCIESFKKDGFEPKLYFRNARGGKVGGNVHTDVAGAMDLVMCPKESIVVGREPRRWHSAIQEATESQMHALLLDDSIWEQGT